MTDRGAYGKGDGLRRADKFRRAEEVRHPYREIPVIILEEPLVLDMIQINGVWVPQE